MDKKPTLEELASKIQLVYQLEQDIIKKERELAVLKDSLQEAKVSMYIGQRRITGESLTWDYRNLFEKPQ